MGLRRGWLDAACGGDRDLRRDVGALLDANDANGMLDDVMGRLHGASGRKRALPRGRPACWSVPCCARAGARRDGRRLPCGARRGRLPAARSRQARAHRIGLRRAEAPVPEGAPHPRSPGTPGHRSPRGWRPHRHGGPFFAMEYIEGTEVREYCNAHRLSVTQRIELVCATCDAVQYAHQNLVVHRGLEAGQHLVTGRRAVKLLDFGVAKLLAEDASASEVATRTGRWITPEYASPSSTWRRRHDGVRRLRPRRASLRATDGPSSVRERDGRPHRARPLDLRGRPQTAEHCRLPYDGPRDA